MGAVPLPLNLATAQKPHQLQLFKGVHPHLVQVVAALLPLNKIQNREVGSIKDLRSEKGSMGGNGLKFTNRCHTPT